MRSGKVLTEERESNLEGKERGNEGEDLKITEEKGEDRRIWRMEAGEVDKRKELRSKKGKWGSIMTENINTVQRVQETRMARGTQV
jgi:hypothetical protein